MAFGLILESTRAGVDGTQARAGLSRSKLPLSRVCEVDRVWAQRPKRLFFAEARLSGPHRLSVQLLMNASSTKPARFVVFLIKNKGAPVLVPVE